MTSAPRAAGQAASGQTPEMGACKVRLSKELLECLRGELDKIHVLSNDSRSEASGLVFGEADQKLVHLVRSQRLDAGEASISRVETADHVPDAFGNCLSEKKSRCDHSETVFGRYVIRTRANGGLLDKDIEIHNTFFGSPNETTLVVTPARQGGIVVKVCAAKPGMSLSTNDYRVGSWRSTKCGAFIEDIDVELIDSSNDEVLLDIYRAATSLEEAESNGVWRKIRERTARLIASFHNISAAVREHRKSTRVDALPARNEYADSSQPALDVRSPSVAGANARQQQTRIHCSPRAIFSKPQITHSRVKPVRVAGWLVGTVVVSLFTYVCAHLYVKPILIRAVARSQTVANAPSVRLTEPVQPRDILKLRVDGRKEGIEVSWDPHSVPVQNAIHGTLWMTDHRRLLRSIKLSPDELKSGRIMYMPLAADVTIHLKVTDRLHRETFEWVSVLNDGRPTNAPSLLRVASSERPDTKPISKLTSHASDGSLRAALSKSSLARQSRLNGAGGLEALRSANAGAHGDASLGRNAPGGDNLALRASDLQRPVYLSPPLDLPRPAKFPEASEDHRQRPSEEPTYPRSTLVAPERGISNQRPVAQVHPPEVLFQYIPTVPMGSGETGDMFVPVLVTISETGKVTGVSLSSADKGIPQYLTDYALNAARKWQFAPSMVNNKPVASTVTIRFHIASPK